MNFRELPKKDWLPCHWDWYVGDAEHMAKLNRDNGRLTQGDIRQTATRTSRRKCLRNCVLVGGFLIRRMLIGWWHGLHFSAI
jgi:hypothetical protein